MFPGRLLVFWLEIWPAMAVAIACAPPPPTHAVRERGDPVLRVGHRAQPEVAVDVVIGEGNRAAVAL